METKLLTLMIGNYSISQANKEECYQCKKAHFGTILIREEDDSDGECWICLECLLRERLYYQLLTLNKYSDAEARAIAYEEPNKLLDGNKPLTK